MHDITRDLLLKQAEHEDREADRLSEQANIHLDRATELEGKSSACRKAAAALRADATQGVVFDLRGIGQTWPGGAGLTYIERRTYDPRIAVNEASAEEMTKARALEAVSHAVEHGDLVSFNRSTTGRGNEFLNISMTVRAPATQRSPR